MQRAPAGTGKKPDETSTADLRRKIELFNKGFFRPQPVDPYIEHLKLDPESAAFLKIIKDFADSAVRHVFMGQQDLNKTFLDFFLGEGGATKIYFVLHYRPVLISTVIDALKTRYSPPPLSKEKEIELFNAYQQDPKIFSLLTSVIGKEAVDTVILNTLRANYTPPLSERGEKELLQLYMKDNQILPLIISAVGQEVVSAFIASKDLQNIPKFC